jgi:hypothetical protein
MLRLWQSAKACSWCRISRESNRWVLCINPTKQRAAFFGVGRYKRDAARRRQKRYRSGINNLKNIKAQSVGHQ